MIAAGPLTIRQRGAFVRALAKMGRHRLTEPRSAEFISSSAIDEGPGHCSFYELSAADQAWCKARVIEAFAEPIEVDA